jgi:hypothetical protein
VKILNNVCKNASSNSIGFNGINHNTEIVVKGNKIKSDVYGSYIFDRRWSGFGVLARLSMYQATPGYNLEICDNTIEYTKPHFGGIMICGPFYAQKESDKLSDGVIRNNQIILREGAVGILMESCEYFDVSDNRIAGSAFFGVGVFPRHDPEWLNMGASQNVIIDNDMTDLSILSPDEYSQKMFIHETYSESKAGKETSNYWLNKNTMKNNVFKRQDETLVDEGKNNSTQDKLNG